MNNHSSSHPASLLHLLWTAVQSIIKLIFLALALVVKGVGNLMVFCSNLILKHVKV